MPSPPTRTCGECLYWTYKWTGRGVDYGICRRFPPETIGDVIADDLYPPPAHRHLVIERQAVSCGEFEPAHPH